jgi:DNA topoisomerase-1
VKRVAEQLGNTPAVCRKSYIHPRVLSSYLDGSLRPVLATAKQCMRAPEMWAVEGLVMRLLALWENTVAAPPRAARKQQGSRDLLLIKRRK